MMKGLYYKMPLDFQSLIEKRDTEKVSLDVSIKQQIFLLATTGLGECKFDENFGTRIWELDFDLMKSDNILKENIAETLKESIERYEKRLILQNIEVIISDFNLGTLGKKRMKKKVTLSIEGLILQTNRPFVFINSFFVGPLSY